MKTEFNNDSWIQRVEYDTDSKQMLIFVKGNKNLYECVNVPIEVFEAFKSSASKGRYFNEVIKNKYNHPMFNP